MGYAGKNCETGRRQNFFIKLYFKYPNINQ
jgi:hypothetical protein